MKNIRAGQIAPHEVADAIARGMALAAERVAAATGEDGDAPRQISMLPWWLTFGFFLAAAGQADHNGEQPRSTH